MGTFFLGLTFIVIFQFAVVGLIIGAMARILIPGPNPMTWGKTAVIGIAGSFFWRNCRQCSWSGEYICNINSNLFCSYNHCLP